MLTSPPRQSGERSVLAFAGFPATTSPPPQPEPSEHSGSTPCHGVALNLGQQGPGKGLNHGMQRDSVPGWSLGGQQWSLLELSQAALQKPPEL